MTYIVFVQLDAENIDLKVKLEHVNHNLLERQSEVYYLTSEKRRVETDFLDLQVNLLIRIPLIDS